MNISVTAQDITNGRRYSLTHCPIALAIKRRLKGAHVEVDYCAIVIDDKKFCPVEQFQSDFDAGRPVKPSRFALEEL